MPAKPLLIYDGRCGFCRIWIDYWKRLLGDSIDFAPSQDVATQYSEIPPSDFGKSVQLIDTNGQVLQGAHAVFRTLQHIPGRGWLLWLYQHVAFFAGVSELGYRITAANRSLAYWVTRVLFGTRIEPARFERLEWLFVRLLALIYLCAFVFFGVQAAGLIGSHGILPLQDYLPAVKQAFGIRRLWVLPTLFWIAPSDASVTWVCVAGAALSIFLLFGRAQRACLAALYILYLSLSSAGQDFLSFQWDALLLESGFLAIFLGSSGFVIWLFRLLLFRLMFLSGAVKMLSHDSTWNSLRALRFHYWTQPLPTPLAWYANQLPESFQRASTFLVLAIEFGVPFLIFLPRRARHCAAAAFVFLQTLIFLTGNYTFFNLLAVCLCLFLLDDQALPRWIPGSRRTLRTSPKLAIPLFGMLGLLGVLEIANTVGESTAGHSVLQLVAPFEIVNSYGLFANMTTSRPEIIVQGSNNGTDWLDYQFKYKPGDLRRAPRWVAPYQPRLDWQMWFAALSNWRSNPWFVNFMVRLLEGSPPVLSLLEKNPFPGQPPQYVRALVFEYRFTDFNERRSTGNWWAREPKGLYLPPISLRDVQRR